MSKNNDRDWVSSTHLPMGFPEFVLLVAAVMALNPLALDSMLPALPDMRAAFGIANPNHLQSILSVFLIGFGLGQFIIGPLSDRFGRRGILLIGMGVYSIASLLAVFAPSFEMLLLARLLQGLGTAATRVIATSIVRDCYTGRRMASVMSLALMIFVAVPIIAPSIGQLILMVAHWQVIFVGLLLYGVLALIWVAWRMPETLPVSERKSLQPLEIASNFGQTLTTRQTIGYALASGCVQGSLFSYVMMAQQIFVGIYDLGVYFPLAFATIALGVASSSFVNSRIVGRFGMRILSHTALVGQLIVGIIMLAWSLLGPIPLSIFMALSIALLFGIGLIISNFTALAMEPMGHIAGTASSTIGSINTLIGIVIGYAVGQMFNNTLMPLATGIFVASLMALVIVLTAERGRLFKPHHKPI